MGDIVMPCDRENRDSDQGRRLYKKVKTNFKISPKIIILIHSEQSLLFNDHGTQSTTEKMRTAEPRLILYGSLCLLCGSVCLLCVYSVFTLWLLCGTL